MKLWQKIGLWTLGVIAWLVLLSSSQVAYRETLLTDFELSFENRKDRSFLSMEEMRVMVQNHLGDSLKSLTEVNNALLEESLDNHPAIAKAEVYSKINGSLRVKLWQHDPLARVINGTASFYVLDGGNKMPTSQHYSKEVPLLSGSINDDDLAQIADFWQMLAEDDFYSNFFSALRCTTQKEWILYPSKGDFKILIGTATELRHKMAKLKVFYQNAPALKNINELKEIDLRFEGQLICRKK
jgi:cell division protein FtsQ